MFKGSFDADKELTESRRPSVERIAAVSDENGVLKVVCEIRRAQAIHRLPMVLLEHNTVRREAFRDTQEM